MEQEILNTLKCHEELLIFDASQILRLKERHRTTKLGSNIRVKSHTLLERTMRIAVPVINISIYLNPALSFLIKPAIITVAMGIEGSELGNIILYIQHVTYKNQTKLVCYCIICRKCI